MRIASLTVAVGMALSAGVSSAQPAAATAPASRPAAPRFVLVVPDGFEKVTVAGHTAVCQPNDVEWVKQGLSAVKPATRPTTMPADLLKRATDGRAAVVKQMVADLALPDDKQAAAFFDDKLLPTLKKMDEIKPPVYFLVCTREKLRELTRDGWGEPRFHFNRLAGEVGFDENISLSIERPMDDSVLPAFYLEKDPPETRAKNLAVSVGEVDASLANLISQQSQPVVFNLIATHVGETYFDPLKLRRDQMWFGVGVTGYFATKYAAALTPMPREQWLKNMTYEDPRYPVSATRIDLVHPADESTMKRGAVPYYNQAIRRKATAAVVKWAEKAGEPSITKAVAAVRAQPPADGPALVKLVEETAKVELSKELGAAQ